MRRQRTVVIEMSRNTERYPSELDDTAIEFARTYLNETPEKRDETLQQLREHFRLHEPDINITTDDDLLIAFLRGSKYNLERAISKVKNYYIMRTELPGIFSDRDPLQERMQYLLKLGCFIPLRELLDGQMVIIIRTAAYDPKIVKFEEALKVGYVILDVCSKLCPRMQVHGVCAVFDMQGVSFGHARQMTPTIIKHLVKSWENYHCRPKYLEFVNAPMYVNVVLNIFKTFMSQKLRNRVRVHFKGYENLHALVRTSILPKEYGGSDGSIQDHIDFWVQEVQNFRSWLIYDEQFKAITV